MPAPKSSRSSTRSKTTPAAQRAGAKRASDSRTSAKRPSGQRTPAKSTTRSAADGIASAAEQVTNRVLKQLDLVMLTRERIQETLDDAASRGRLTRTDANALVAELVARGRQQTDELVKELEQLVDRGREGIESATRRARRAEPVDRIVRGADRARRTVGVGQSFPILGYDELTVRQVEQRIRGLERPELRKVCEYERRNANRKSVLGAIEKALR